jgi:transcriptional regulator with XRE-family HTH domain
MAEKLHIGRKIGRVRELRNMKQESVAEALGISQQAISKIENSEQVDDLTLNRIAKVLGVNADVIKNFDEEKTIFNIQNNYDNANPSINFPYQCNFNPLDKYVEAMEENKRLYEALLKSEREKVAMLQKMFEKK